jgi:hypothetical protein
MAINESWVVSGRSGVVLGSAGRPSRRFGPPQDEGLRLERAKAKHRRLVERESRGFGDTDGAMRRLSELGLPYWTQWSLRAGRLKRATSCTGDILARVRSALLRHLAASVRADLAALNLELEEANGAPETDLEGLAAEVREAQTLLADIARAVGDGARQGRRR